MADAETVLPHPALGTRLLHLQELSLPEDARRFREVAEAAQPCVLRGVAARWPIVERGRFDPATAAELRRRMGSRHCHVSFEPSSTFFDFDVPEDWTAPIPQDSAGGSGTRSAETGSLAAAEEKAGAPRLINPGRIAMPFASFLDACDRKCNGGGASSCTTRVVNVSYDLDEDEEQQEEEPGAARAEGWARSNAARAAALEGEAPFDVPLAALERLALYCVEDADVWPQDLFGGLVPEDPAAELAPDWLPLLRDRRVWMSAGGPEGVAHVTAGFHWDHMQNLHVLLSGRKEVFLLPPLEAAALHATRFCPQAQWRLQLGGLVELAPLLAEESSSDYAVVGVDQDFAVNAMRSPALRELQKPPRWTVLRPGDAVYIPPGWWHSVRTWRPRRDERGLPFSLSVNFWYGLTGQASKACQPELFTLQVLSCQRAMAGSPQDHLEAFLRRLESRGGGPRPSQEPEDDVASAGASAGEFAAVD